MDLVGLLYFPRKFRFVHDALEDFMANAGIPFEHLFYQEGFLFVVVHCEADYYVPMHLGDLLEIHLGCSHIGTTSFSLSYRIMRKGENEKESIELGRAKTTHVVLDKVERKKIAIPEVFLKILKDHTFTS